MADAYGSIIVSGNYVANVNILAKKLSEFNWSTDNSQPFVRDSKIWFPLNIQYPTVVLTYDTFKDENGTIYNDSNINQAISDFDELENFEIGLEEYTLKEISEMISPLIQAGSLELTASSQEKDRYCFFDNLKISSNGSVELFRISKNIFEPSGQYSHKIYIPHKF